MLGYNDWEDSPELEEEPVKDVIDDEFDSHADYGWDDHGYDDPMEGPYDGYEGDEGVKSEEGDDICKKCDGTGEFPEDHLCKACGGLGYIDR